MNRDKTYSQAGRLGRPIALLAILGGLVIGGAQAPPASAANDYCSPSGHNYYGEACLYAPSGGEFTQVGGYIESSQLSDSSQGFIDNDMWLVEPNAPNQQGAYWVEAGMISGYVLGFGQESFELFWGDNRPGSMPYIHILGPGQPNTNYFDEIYRQDSTDWGVYNGGYQPTSVNNSMVPSLIRTGTEQSTWKVGTACSEQSNLDYTLSGQSAHAGWTDSSGTGQLSYDLPPFAQWLSAYSSVQDWAHGADTNPTTSKSYCWPTGAAPVSSSSSLGTFAGTTVGGRHRRAGARRSADTGPPLTAAQITQLAGEAAAAEGDANPSSIEHVESSRQEAVFALSGTGVSTNPDVYTIVMRGNFVANDMPVPSGVPAPTGSVLTVVIDANTGALTDFGVGNQVPNLTGLGTVTVDGSWRRRQRSIGFCA